MPPFIFVPKRYSNFRPDWVGELPGRGYAQTVPGGRGRAGRQLAGRRVRVTRPPPGVPYDPVEHVEDLGPDDGKRPYFIIPGYGMLERAEMEELAIALRERQAHADPAKGRSQRKPIDQRLWDYADSLLRQKANRRTITMR